MNVFTYDFFEKVIENRSLTDEDIVNLIKDNLEAQYNIIDIENIKYFKSLINETDSSRNKLIYENILKDYKNDKMNNKKQRKKVIDNLAYQLSKIIISCRIKKNEEK